MLKAEHEALGFYITAHPLDKYEGDLKRFTSSLTEQLPSRDSGTKVSIGGVIQALKLRNSKKGERYASFTLEDKTGTVDVIAWPDTYKKFESVFTTDEPVCVSGNLEVDEERCQIIADEVVLLTAARERSTQEVHLALRADKVSEDGLRTLRATLTQHAGECRCFLHLLLPNRTETIIALPPDLKVTPSETMIDAVEQIFGRGVASFQ